MQTALLLFAVAATKAQAGFTRFDPVSNYTYLELEYPYGGNYGFHDNGSNEDPINYSWDQTVTYQGITARGINGIVQSRDFGVGFPLENTLTVSGRRIPDPQNPLFNPFNARLTGDNAAASFYDLPNGIAIDIKFQVEGFLAPGDTARIAVGGMGYEGQFLVANNSDVWTIDTPGAFSRELVAHLQRERDYQGNLYLESHFSFEIARALTGDDVPSWIGFADPGINVHEIMPTSATVAEPASLVCWGLFGCSAAVIGRTMQRRRRSP